MADISRLPPRLQPLAQRVDSGLAAARGAAGDGDVTLSELARARAANLFSPADAALASELETLLGGAPAPATRTSPASGQALDVSGVRLTRGKPVALPGVDASRPIAYVDAAAKDGSPLTVRVGREAQRNRADGSATNWGFAQPTFGPVTVEGSGALDHATVHYADPAGSFADYFSIPAGQDGIKNGQALTLQLPPSRKGLEIENIDVSFHAPLRDWNAQTKREGKPTYCDWYTDDVHLGRKFVDPNADNGNAPEIDNVHGENASGATTLAPAGRTLKIVAENTHIPASEDAMSVQWVRVTYKPKDAQVQEFHFKGAPLPNSEWKGKWLQPGERLGLDLDPTKKVSRVEVQWSDKPDDVGFDEPGKWATGSLFLDGKPIGVQNEHVGSPEWQFFDNLRGAQGKRLEIAAADSPLKVFEVKVYYQP